MCSRKWIVRISALGLMVALLLFSALAAGEDQQAAPLVVRPLTNGLLEANSNRQIHPLFFKKFQS